MTFFKSNIFKFVLKVTLALVFGYSIYYQVFAKEDFYSVIKTIYKDFSYANYSTLLLVIFLMLCNWSIESLKWQLLVKKFQPINFLNSFKSVLCGVTIGTFTPNRVGEFGGRILFLNYTNRIMGIIVTLVGSFGQIITTLITGTFGFTLFIFFLLKNPFLQEIEGIFLQYIILVLALVLIVFSIILYFNIGIIFNILIKYKWIKKLKAYISVLTKFGYQDLIKLLILSFIRYGVFTLQYIVLLHLFQVNIPFFVSVIIIFNIFFLQMLIPSITIIEIGIRGSVALYFFNFYSSNNLGIICASFSLWLINLIIPALIGSIILLRKNIDIK